ncbi:MAG: acyl-CoA thioesterase [Nitrososphaerota archaeon]
MREHIERIRVTFGDTDSTGRVYFPSYVRWLDNTFIEMLRKADIVFSPNGGLLVCGKTLGQTLVIGEYFCRIESPSTYDDEILIKVSIREVRPKVLVVDAVFTRSSDGHILGRGTISYVCVDISSGRSAEIPSEILAKLS